MVAVTKLRIKFGPEGSVKTFQKVPDINNSGNAKLIEKSFGEDVAKPANQSRKRGANELEEVQANKRQKLDRVLSSQCSTLLKLLMEQQYGCFFSEPVDPVKLQIPDYFSIISKPIDLGTIKSRLLKNAYSSADEFAADVRLTFDNAMLYNPPENFVHKMAMKYKEMFEVRWESIGKKKISKLSVIEVRDGSKSQSSTGTPSGRFPVELPKPVKEKSEKVSLLLKPVKGQSKKDTPVVTPKALATKLRIKKLEPGLGTSTTVKTSSKGSALTASCNCGLSGRITCICLKSCHSSGSEVSSLTDCLVKNTLGSQASESDPHSNGSVSSTNEKNGCVSSQLDKPSNSGLLDKELKTTLPVMPPLPPEKALRAAILKGQFAETILKAKHRKILDKNNNNKADLIRIQIEKEQMERTQREEKARIEAEMRAAEIATRRRGETELKQKRERQRLELEKVEKTFDFEENNYVRLDEDMVYLCGSSNLTRTMLLELGLFLRRDDDCLEEIDSDTSDAMRTEDLEEGEIF